MLDRTLFKYNQEEQRPRVIVTFNGVEVADTVGYELTLPEESIEVGKYSVTVSGTNNFAGCHRTLGYEIDAQYFTVETEASEGGNITPTKNYSFGSDAVINFVPDAGTYTIKAIKADHKVVVAYKQMTFIVNATAGKGGSISPAGETEVVWGQDLTLRIVADKGYRIKSINDNNVEKNLAADSTIVLQHIVEDRTVTVTFDLMEFTVKTTKINDGGTIYGGAKYNYGSTAEIIVNPGQGYQVDYVLLDGERVELSESNTFLIEDIDADHEVKAAFKHLQFTIFAETTGGVHIDGAGVYDWGTDVTLKVRVDEGYDLISFTIDNVTAQLNKNNERKLSKLMNDHTAMAVATKKKFDVHVDAAFGGEVTGAGTYEWGDVVTVAVRPDEYHEIEYFEVDGKEISLEPVTGADYVIDGIKDNHDIVVRFRDLRIYWTVDARAVNDGGYVDGGGIFEEGTDVYVAVKPIEGFTIDYALVDDREVEVSNDTIYFNNLSANHVVEVAFKVRTYNLVAEVTDGGRTLVNGVEFETDTTLEFGYKDIVNYEVAAKPGYVMTKIIVDGKVVLDKSNGLNEKSTTEEVNGFNMDITVNEDQQIVSANCDFGTISDDHKVEAVFSYIGLHIDEGKLSIVGTRDAMMWDVAGRRVRLDDKRNGPFIIRVNGETKKMIFKVL